MKLNPLFQIGLDVAGRTCLVIGGGREAENKTERLLEAGADLTLVSPRLTPALREWATAERLVHHQRTFRPSDMEGAFLVLNTVGGDPELSRQVFALASRQGCLINSYDSPDFSNFGMVALVRPGHLRLGIGTSNASPALAGRLCRDLESIFDREFVDYLDLLARVRARVRERVSDLPRCAALLRPLVRDFHLEGRLRYPENWRQQLTTLLTCDFEHCATPQRCPACPLLPLDADDD
jgi:precorrin-2 dehydrogenase / sirohydrochlorin ferrochelatase